MTIDRKACWLFLFTVGLMTMLFPRPVLAQERTTELTLTLVSGDYYDEITAGKDNILFLEIRNIGSRAITNIRLSSEKPEDWVVEFRPGEIDYLDSDSLKTVDVSIKPDGKTAKGRYRVILIAETNEIRRVSSIWVTVETPGFFWLWVGVIVGLIVVAGFVFIFVCFGRQ